jgi:hypothetical protein
VIDLAIHYARQGFRVFPLVPGGKEPAVPKRKGGHGCLDATTDIEAIERWWTAYPDANIGIATGRGLLVIDVDPRKSDRWLESLQALAIPRTFTTKTWSGGWHLYLSMPPDSRITIGADLLPGIDWRGNSGYVVAVGSVVGGALYEIANNVPIAAAPSTLLERLRTASGKRRDLVRSTRVEHEGTDRMVIPVSRRNDTLLRIGCALRRWGVDYAAILGSLRVVNAEHSELALGDGELQRIAASAARYPATEPQGVA